MSLFVFARRSRSRIVFIVAGSVAVLYDHGEYHALCDLDAVVNGRV